ncbi:anti-sigma factor family protein [Lysobacter cavernae]|uniref:Anti-sigma factor family protein n=1 Tax=Lysobacter cavernae TaxID=1685901 RepID=A0ABV7RR07_9GAMM
MLPFEGSAHSEAERLLPWFVNATLDGDELARVQCHLAECARCQREVEQLRALHRACTEAAAVPDATPSLRRLRHRLRAPVVRASWPRWRAVREAWAATPTWLRCTVAAQCAVMLVLTGLLLGGGSPSAMYRTLGEAAAPAPAVDVHHLAVVFDPQIEQAQMQRLLRASQARIVDGPNDAGAYVLAVPAARAAAVREALRAAPGVVLVESLGPRERR